MKAALVGVAGCGALLVVVAETQLHELDAEDPSRAQVAGDAAGRVDVLGPGHTDVDLRQEAQVGACGPQRGRQGRGTTAALHVPCHHTDPPRERGRRGGRLPLGLVEARDVGQQPVVERGVAQLCQPLLAYSCVRCIHPASLSPLRRGRPDARTAVPGDRAL